MGGVRQGGGKLGDKVQTTVGQKVYLQVAQTSKFPVPLISLCELPLLHAQSRGILLPGQMDKTWLAAVCLRPGTYKLTAYSLYLNPYTGRLCEAVDTCVIVCAGKKGQQKGNPTGQTGDGTSTPSNDPPETDTSPGDSTGVPGGEQPEGPDPTTSGDTGVILSDGPTEDPSLLGGLPQGSGQSQNGKGSGSKKDGSQKGGSGKKPGK
jgi:hypothetical protein